MGWGSNTISQKPCSFSSFFVVKSLFTLCTVLLKVFTTLGCSRLCCTCTIRDVFYNAVVQFCKDNYGVLQCFCTFLYSVVESVHYSWLTLLTLLHLHNYKLRMLNIYYYAVVQLCTVAFDSVVVHFCTVLTSYQRNYNYIEE